MATRKLHEDLMNGQEWEYDLEFARIGPEWSNSYDEMPQYMKIGKIKINKQITNYFNDIERLAFQVENIVPGIQIPSNPYTRVLSLIMRDCQDQRLGTLRNEYESGSVGDVGTLSNKVTNCFGPEFRNQAMDVFLYSGKWYHDLLPQDHKIRQSNLIQEMMFVSEALHEELIRIFLKVDEGLGKEIAKGLAF